MRPDQWHVHKVSKDCVQKEKRWPLVMPKLSTWHTTYPACFTHVGKTFFCLYLLGLNECLLLLFFYNTNTVLRIKTKLNKRQFITFVVLFVYQISALWNYEIIRIEQAYTIPSDLWYCNWSICVNFWLKLFLYLWQIQMQIFFKKLAFSNLSEEQKIC